MGPEPDRADVPGSDRAAGRPAPVLVNTTPPEILGATAVVGTPMATAAGAWTNTPTAFGYQWKRNGVNIAGASSQVYTPGAADVGAWLSTAVTAQRLRCRSPERAATPSGRSPPRPDRRALGGRWNGFSQRGNSRSACVWHVRRCGRLALAAC